MPAAIKQKTSSLFVRSAAAVVPARKQQPAHKREPEVARKQAQRKPEVAQEARTAELERQEPGRHRAAAVPGRSQAQAAGAVHTAGPVQGQVAAAAVPTAAAVQREQAARQPWPVPCGQSQQETQAIRSRQDRLASLDLVTDSTLKP